MKNSPGVVLVTKFVTNGEKMFSSYIDYINREVAIRNKNIEKYNQFMDYMGNPEKTGELFTADKDNLSKEQKENLKELFRQAQKNESILWQTVFSFRNDWLEEQGILRDGILDENKMKEIVRGSMDKMLEKEKIKENAVWSAAIHYNTDNIHIHIATTEPTSVREKKRLELVEVNENWLKQYPELQDRLKDICNNRENGYQDRKLEREFLKQLKENLSADSGEKNRLGNWLDITDEGKLIVSSVGKREERSEDNEYLKVIESRMEYKGGWKQSTINSGKSFVINKLLDQQKENDLINSIMRDTLLAGKKNIQLKNDYTLKNEFFKIYQHLPEDRRQWSYASNTLGNGIRKELDQLSKTFMEKYFPNEIKELKGLLEEQSKKYEEAYGAGEFSAKYYENKMLDLYKRMGNSILREMKNFDRDTRKKMGNSSSTGTGSSVAKKSSGNIKTGMNNSHVNLGRSMLALKRYLEKDIENYKNQLKYKQLENEIIETVSSERKDQNMEF